ncbi:sel1 repeat family protein [Thalassospira xiamenensis]|uniref:sel1 repeat family protein n=1 Tax=Thalassospira xiamenensis TaxID=220697 RepID=UPI002000494E|nr:sel1 repeat family protein [Thalassospira xiamenensis]MCK2169324.1 sel1 repeat family protein [Thalassospira xiamenensis]
MKNSIAYILKFSAVTTGVTLCLMATATAASPLDEGVNSYRHGNFESSAKTFAPLAEQGNATAQYLLSCQMINGIGVPTDQSAGWAMMEAAASSTQPDASMVLARRLEATNGDKESIKSLYMTAAEQKQTQAMLWLALDAIDQGDKAHAKELLTDAWNEGDPRAATLLATRFAENDEDRISYLSAAAEKGELRAAAYLAEISREKDDRVGAVGWCAIASGLPGHAANVDWKEIGMAVERTCAKYDEDLKPAARAQNRANVDQFLSDFFADYKAWKPWRPCAVR